MYYSVRNNALYFTGYKTRSISPGCHWFPSFNYEENHPENKANIQRKTESRESQRKEAEP